MDWYSQELPDSVLASTECNGVIGRFNKGKGSYLAVGRSEGFVCVYDFATMSVVQWLQGHVRSVTAVSWSANGRFLLSASRDWTVIVWDLKTAEKHKSVRFDAPVTSAEFHPRTSKILLVTLQNQAETILVDLRPGGGKFELAMDFQRQDSLVDPAVRNKVGRQREYATLARFYPSGKLVAVGSSTGSLYIFDTDRKECVRHEKVCSSAIRDIGFDADARTLVVNAGDRCIRVYGIESDGTFDLQHKMQDVVNSNQWIGAILSRSGDLIAAGAQSAHKTPHAIHIWDRATGSLLKILQGPKDSLEDLDWHPIKPLLVSLSDSGHAHVWGVTMPDRWAAYAADFEELDENIEYLEKEDEFDMIAQTELDRRRLDGDKVVDIRDVSVQESLSIDSDDNDPTFAPTHQDDWYLGYEEHAEPPPPRGQQHTLLSDQIGNMPGNFEPGEAAMLAQALAQIDQEEQRPKRRRR